MITVRSDDDPMVAVDSFLSRNRKEADLSINNLTKEAEALRARLQKVEEALARWQTVSEALNHGSDPVANGPGPKPSARNWRRQPTPESVPPLPPPQPGPESPAGLTPPLSEPEPAFLPPAKEGPPPVLIPPPSGAEELPLPKAEY